jgi:hypothetical protein
MAAVNLNLSRLLHLLVLLIASCAIALPLQLYLDWNRLGAFGLAVPIVCQLNAIFLSVYQLAPDEDESKHSAKGSGGKKKRRAQAR